jgi:5'/3'-nucleotidase SurE
MWCCRRRQRTSLALVSVSKPHHVSSQLHDILTRPSGSSDEEPQPRQDACEYNSCPAGTGQPVGNNATNTRLNWVNSFPVTAARYGIDTFGPQFWNGEAPEMVVSGPNVGTNLWLQVPFSGTVGIAVHAAHEHGIPGIAFSGASDGNLAWDTSNVPPRATVYAALAANLTDRILAGGAPYLPAEVWLNVNFPAVADTAGDACTDPTQFTWVLTRINPGVISAPDVDHCGSTRLPTETDVHFRGGCLISVSVGDARDKTTAPAADQQVVRDRLSDLWTCV